MKKILLLIVISLVLPLIVIATTTPQELRNQIRQEFQNKIKTIREEAKTKIETARANLKIKLQKIKDKVKATRVENINNQIQKLNERWTDHFANVLNRLSEILERINSRTDKAAANGVDVGNLRTIIDTASSTINSARTAVATQAAKVYTLTITTENNLRVDVGKTRQALHSDLVKLRDTITGARDAVHNAAQELNKIVK